jgi:CubicO group peptidase (beta-lactamase class C family)
MNTAHFSGGCAVVRAHPHALAGAVVLFAALGCGSSSSEPSNSAPGAAGTIGAAGESGSGGNGASVCDGALAELEAKLGAKLDAVAEDTAVTADPDLTLLLAARDGRRFVHSHGDSTAMTSYESASTSKLVAAVVLLDLVDEGVLSLESKPNDLISFWSDESAVTLRELLSFRSGFNDEPLLCINAPQGNFANCVQTIYENNLATATAPGTEFHYSSTHLQIAGLMAVEATGEPWSAIFEAWKAKTGLFGTALFDLPSPTNPRLAGGMHWTGEEYLRFLEALLAGTILSDKTRSELFANQRGAATVGASPAIDALDEDWSYGFGNWLECPNARGPNSYDCGEGHRNSSPGAYGAYPFIDVDHEYVGVLARQGALGTFREGLEIFRAVEELANEWADYRCSE